MKRFALIALAVAALAISNTASAQSPTISCDHEGICRISPLANQLLREGGDYAVTPMKVASAPQMPSALLAQDDAPAPAAPAPAAPAPFDFKAELMKGLLQVGLPALLGVLSLLGAALHLGLKRWLDEKSQTSAVARIGQKVLLVGSAVVSHIEEGMKAKLLEKVADGDLSAQDVVDLKNEGMRLIKEALGTDGLDEIEAVLGIPKGSSLDTFLSGVIERQLGILQAQKATTAAAAIATAASPS